MILLRVVMHSLVGLGGIACMRLPAASLTCANYTWRIPAFHLTGLSYGSNALLSEGCRWNAIIRSRWRDFSPLRCLLLPMFALLMWRGYTLCSSNVGFTWISLSTPCPETGFYINS